MTVIVPQAAWYLARRRRQRIANSLAVSGAPVTTAAVGGAYTGFIVAASGGAGTYTYSLASGALPPGLALNASTGSVSGTPTLAGVYTATIRAADIAGNHVDLPPFTITVT